ncbi:MAG TPA: NADH-quinone oxidoreductase subunit L, partial [Mycobacterium sp.]|nr:NADH-quinone oxidoreductase subunit L [Mycobacterium sp.]
MTTAHGIESAAWLLVAIPAISAGVLLLGGKRADKWGHVLGALVPVVLFVYGVMLFFAVKAETGAGRQVSLHLFSWIPVGSFQVDAGMLLDPLSMVFVLLITGVGALIHIYAVGYMKGDPGRRRFFGWFNLFIAAMLLLVLGDNYLSLYVGWEGVGLASYLLIGYYADRPVAATAAKKAFIANRVGDVGLSIAIMIMFAYFGTTSFTGVFASMGGASKGLTAALGLMLLLGACGKSGQFPLQTWLPDAMEGPTPVSALIHAATMVTAGVYLVGRMHPMYDVAIWAHGAVAVIGAATALFAATIGLVQTDIKRVLAYSTMSQIGYMFLAVGVGAYAAGFYHLIAHAFFKALLFMAAGNVIHAMHDEQDMRKFGGMWKDMRVTSVCFLAGALSLAGIIPFVGFWSKEMILGETFSKGGAFPLAMWAIGFVTAALTAFYTGRMWWMAFWRRKSDERPVDHPHEAQAVMLIPVTILAVLATVFGFVQTTALTGEAGPQAISNFLAATVGR